VFPNWSADNWDTAVRNCAVTTIAPTGTISMVAGCSSGIEPRFAASWNKDVLNPMGVDTIDEDLVAEVRNAHGVSNDEAVRRIRVGEQLNLPSGVARKYRYAHDISGTWHTLIAAHWQRYTDNGVSKTVNLPSTATVDDVDELFRLAWRTGCKGISVYREGSRACDLLRRTSRGSAEIRQSKQLLAQRRT
jgi:ribonucleoside-diphosphate reductase alpha chain